VRYVFLIYLDPDVLPAPETPELQEEWRRYDEFTKATGERELFETADALQPPDTGTTVRVRNDETIVTDGPFAETKEQLAGFYVLHCEDIDEALELASRIPGARHGAVEIRPVLEYGLARDPDFLETARATGRR
jgi:hypothetical protein